MQAFVQTFSQSENMKNIFHFLPYLKDRDIGILASKIYDAKVDMHPENVCHRFFEALYVFSEHNPLIS